MLSCVVVLMKYLLVKDYFSFSLIFMIGLGFNKEFPIGTSIEFLFLILKKEKNCPIIWFEEPKLQPMKFSTEYSKVY